MCLSSSLKHSFNNTYTKSIPVCSFFFCLSFSFSFLFFHSNVKYVSLFWFDISSYHRKKPSKFLFFPIEKAFNDHPCRFDLLFDLYHFFSLHQCVLVGVLHVKFFELDKFDSFEVSYISQQQPKKKPLQKSRIKIHIKRKCNSSIWWWKRKILNDQFNSMLMMIHTPFLADADLHIEWI